MSAGAAIAASVIARHRLRRVRRAPLRLVLGRLGRPPAHVSIEHRTAVAGARLQLVVAPTFTLSRIVAAGAAAPAGSPIAPTTARLRPGILEVQRLVERVVRLLERREAVPPTAPPAMVSGASTTARPGPAPPHDLVLATPPPAPAQPAAAAPAPALATRAPAPRPPTDPGLPATGADLARLADHVLARIDRRIVAERERRGRV